ncbi:MAG: transketolase [Lachnospiraceae bacterium]|nr:transketolase [Lachnospiraceae bacterium]
MDKKALMVAANKVRQGIITGVYHAKCGHPGGSLSAAEIFTYLYYEEMRIDPGNPKDPDRDRFVLSKGHVAPGLYSTLANRGFFDVEALKTLRHTGSFLQGHPDMKSVPGVDMSTGSLGQGLSGAVGMALAGKLQQKDYRVYALTGDGELEEGQIWEAAMFAGHRKLDNLTVIIDNNNLQIDGSLDEVCSPDPIDKKFEAFNFYVQNINGNDFDEIAQALKNAREHKGQPSAIVAHTLKGKGVSYMENACGWHGKAPNQEEYEIAMEELKKEEAALCQR